MSHNSSDGLFGFLQRFSSSTTTVLGFVSTLIGFFKLVQNEGDLAARILLTVGIILLWLTCAYIYWKSNSKDRTPGFKPPTFSQRRKKIRRFALAGIIAIPILSVASFFGWQYYQSLPTNNIIVLVADFEGPDPKNYRVAKNISDRLVDATKKYTDVRIHRLNQVISESEIARKQGKKRKATIVIWGDYGVTDVAVQMSPHFEVLNPPKHLPELKQQPQTPAVSELKSFKLQTRLSHEMAYLSLFTLGMTRYAAADWDGAITRFSDALSQTTENTSALNRSIVHYFRGNAYLDKNDGRSLEDYSQALKLQPNFADAHTNRGIIYFSKGDYSRALADYDQALKLQPNSAKLYSNRGLTYFHKNDYKRALTDFNQSLKLQPNALAYTNRGFVYLHKSDNNSALADFNQALKLQPTLAWVYANRAAVYFNQGNYDLALADFNKALELQPKWAMVYANRGGVYAYKEEFDLAIEDFTQALQLQPNLPTAYVNRSIVYLRKGEIDRAIADVNQALKLKNQPVESDFNLTNANFTTLITYVFLGNIEAAAYNNRGVAHFAKRDYNRTIADINQALKLEPNSFQGYFIRALSYGKQGKHDRALTDLDRALKLKPDLAEAYQERARIYDKKGDYERAIADLNRAINLQPKNANAYNSRGWLYAQRGEYDRALADANQALKLQPDAAHITDTRGFAYAGKSDYNRALADYNQALKLNPKADYAYLHRGLVYRKQGKKNLAIADFKKALELAKDVEKRRDAEKQLQELSMK